MAGNKLWPLPSWLPDVYGEVSPCPCKKMAGRKALRCLSSSPLNRTSSDWKPVQKESRWGHCFKKIVFSSLSFSVLSETVPLRLWDNLWVHGGRRVRNTSLDDVVCKSGWNARNWTAARKRPTTDERVFSLICLNGVGERKRYRCHADAWDNCTLCSLLPLSEWVFLFFTFSFSP